MNRYSPWHANWRHGANARTVYNRIRTKQLKFWNQYQFRNPRLLSRLGKVGNEPTESGPRLILVSFAGRGSSPGGPMAQSVSAKFLANLAGIRARRSACRNARSGGGAFRCCRGKKRRARRTAAKAGSARPRRATERAFWNRYQVRSRTSGIHRWVGVGFSCRVPKSLLVEVGCAALAGRGTVCALRESGQWSRNGLVSEAWRPVADPQSQKIAAPLEPWSADELPRQDAPPRGLGMTVSMATEWRMKAVPGLGCLRARKL